MKHYKFYVIYDRNDFVKYFGTAQDLVNDGAFANQNSVRSLVSHIRNGRVPGKVVILK